MAFTVIVIQEMLHQRRTEVSKPCNTAHVSVWSAKQRVSRGAAERRAARRAGSTKNSNCSCAPFFNVTSGSGLVVTESGGACILSDSAVPWCVVNLTTCASPRTVRRNRGEPWDYCERPAHLNATSRVRSGGQRRTLWAVCLAVRLFLSRAINVCVLRWWCAPHLAACTSRAELPWRGWGGQHFPACCKSNSCVPLAGSWKHVLLKPVPKNYALARAGTDAAGKRALIYSYAPQAAPSGQGGQDVPLAPILGSVIPAAVLAALGALAAAWWWRRRKEKKRKLSAAPSSKARLPQDSDAILTPNSSGPFPVNMENVEEYMVKPADFQILRRKDGSDWLLGQGAFGKARPVCQPQPYLSVSLRPHGTRMQKQSLEMVGAAAACAALKSCT